MPKTWFLPLVLSVSIVTGWHAAASAQGTAQDGGAGQVDGTRIASADNEPGQWLSYGRTYDEQRFSPLDQINADNVDQLGLAWSYDTGQQRGHEATPIVVDGRMYLTASWSVVYALDAATGRNSGHSTLKCRASGRAGSVAMWSIGARPSGRGAFTLGRWTVD